MNELPSPPEGSSIGGDGVDPSISDVNTPHSRDETLRASSPSANSSVFTNGKPGTQTTNEADKPSKKSDTKGHSSAENLVGKINNLVTTDLGNITDSTDFLLVVLYIPLKITLCITFLYLVLGWRWVHWCPIPIDTKYLESYSAFVGLTLILLLSPLPGYVAKHIQDVQFVRLKKTDARVQNIAESRLSSTQGIHDLLTNTHLFSYGCFAHDQIFGWERNMNKKVAKKRDEEFIWIWRRQVLDLINGNLKPVSSSLIFRAVVHIFFV
jgi:hypothetical protein